MCVPRRPAECQVFIANGHEETKGARAAAKKEQVAAAHTRFFFRLVTPVLFSLAVLSFFRQNLENGRKDSFRIGSIETGTRLW